MLLHVSITFKLLIKREMMVRSAHAALHIPAILPSQGKVHWPVHVFLASRSHLACTEPKSVSHQHLSGGIPLFEEITTALAVHYFPLPEYPSEWDNGYMEPQKSQWLGPQQTPGNKELALDPALALRDSICLRNFIITAFTTLPASMRLEIQV